MVNNTPNIQRMGYISNLTFYLIEKWFSKTPATLFSIGPLDYIGGTRVKKPSAWEGHISLLLVFFYLNALFISV